jgi:hypothetical protein
MIRGVLLWMWGVRTLTQNHPLTHQYPTQALLGLGRHLRLTQVALVIVIVVQVKVVIMKVKVIKRGC